MNRLCHKKKKVINLYFVTGLPNPVGISVSFRGFFLLFFSVSGKVLPVTPLLSGVFVHRVFCAYFVRFEGAGVMRSLLCTINVMASKVIVTRMAFSYTLKRKYTHMELKNGTSRQAVKQRSGILEATSNGLRQRESFARRAEIRMSCTSNISPR